jgi:hypothetical protein
VSQNSETVPKGEGALFAVVTMPLVSDPERRTELMRLYTELPAAIKDAVLRTTAPADEHEYARWKAATDRLAKIRTRISEITGE